MLSNNNINNNNPSTTTTTLPISPIILYDHKRSPLFVLIIVREIVRCNAVMYLFPTTLWAFHSLPSFSSLLSSRLSTSRISAGTYLLTVALIVIAF